MRIVRPEHVSAIFPPTSLGAAWWSVIVGALSACLAIVHCLAIQKGRFLDGFAVVNPHTINNLRLIAFVDQHRAWAIAYMALMLAVLVFSSWRRHPMWVPWICFALLVTPCLLYLDVCLSIANKFVLIDILG